MLLNVSQPALTPLLLIIEKHRRPVLRPSSVSDPGALLFINSSVAGTTLAAAFATLILSDGNLRETALSTVPVTALLLVYTALIPRVADGNRFLPSVDVDEAIVSLSLRIVAVLVLALGVQTMVFGVPSS